MTGRRERKKRETRLALLDATLALVRQRGIDATRVEDITERADVGKGAFYNYFDSKDAVVAALLDDSVSRLVADYLSRVPADLAPAGARIELVAREHDRFFREHPEYMLLFHQARGVLHLHTSGRDQLRGAFRLYLQRLCDVMFPPEHLPSCPSDECLDAAAVLAGSVAGYRSFCLAARRTVDPSSLVTWLAQGLQPLLGGTTGSR